MWAHGAALLAGGHGCPPRWGGAQHHCPPNPPLSSVPAAGDTAGTILGTLSLNGDGAVAEVGFADEGVDEDGAALAARILRGTEDGVQPLTVRAPHDEAFATQRFGHRVVVCREGTVVVALSPPWGWLDVGGDRGPRGVAR